MKTLGVLFGGFGGVEIGAMQAGMVPAWSVELDPAIAEVAAANLGGHVRVADVLDCDPMRFDWVDALHASPPCTNASQANANGGETALDIALAHKVAEFVTVLKPSIFTLENVWNYRTFKAWRIIEDALWGAGYWLSVEHCNSADYGVPQTRKRMIVRAVRGGFVPYLPEPKPWVGWYAAIEDLLPALPESRFADWQLARLPELLATTLVGTDSGMTMRQEAEPAITLTAGRRNLQLKSFLINGSGNTNFAEAYPGRGCRYAEEPAHTVTATSKEGGALPKAWLVDGSNASPTGQLTIRTDDEPTHTVTTGGPKHPSRSLLSSGRVVQMTPRALARFQSVPDWCVLPDNARLAAKGIGNAVPPLLMQRVFESLAN